MNSIELNSINLQSIDIASNNVSSIGKSIKRNKDIKLLPKEYQQVEYIEGTGTQFIDTNLIFKSNTRLSGGFLINSQSVNDRQHVFGTYKAGNRYRISTNDNGDTIFYWFGNQAYTNKTINSNKTLDVVITKDHVTIFNNKIKVLDIDLTLDMEFSENDVSITLFGGINLIYSFFTGRFYHFTAFEGETIVRNMIPCYRKSDGEVGMYDTVNNVFYTNEGTGSFIKGPNVSNSDIPYIKGHITNSASTFTFTVNENENITVSVNSDGWWKWYVDRRIVSLNSAFMNKTNIDKLFLCKLDLRIDLRSFFVNNGISTYHIIDISKCYFIGGSDKTTWFTASSKCIVYFPVITGPIYGILSSQTQAFATKDILYNIIEIGTTNALTKENVLSFIKHAAISLTIKLSSTIYAKCKQDGEWYDDIQAAIDAKALKGYTVTLISA